MSNYLAVATVTATLQRVLQSVMVADGLGATATTVRPDAPGQHGAPTLGVNIFLYEIAPNAALRNLDLPTRSGNGHAAVQRPAAALDLHYLLSFYGDTDLGAQRVLGSVVRYLHSRPLLTRSMIQDTVQNVSFLAKSNLADAVEPVRLCPLSLSLEELSKLWSIFFQTPYVLSAAYRASLVFIEEELTPVTPLPVRERQLFVVPFQQPFIESVDPQIIASDATLTIRGQNLRGDVTELKFGDTPATPATVTADKITVALQTVKLQPGVRTVQVVQDFDFKTGILGNEPHRGFESNVAPFILQPRIVTDPIPYTNAGDTLTLTLAPTIGREQSVDLLLNSDTDNYVIPRKRQPTDLPTATSFDFEIPDTAATHEYLVRVRVDGAESALEVDTNEQSPTYNQYIGPKGTITP
jgi:Pvc16 N-terminal domain/IPT/TIG domain